MLAGRLAYPWVYTPGSVESMLQWFESQEGDRLKIAVVGSGVSGLAVAHLLGRRHEVTVFEADTRLGGHIHTVSTPQGHAVDTGFIVFNEPNYPHFCRLLDSLEVESQPTSMSFSVRDDRDGTEYSGGSLGALFAQRANLLRPGHWRMLAGVKRFMKSGALLAQEPPELTVEQFLERDQYGREFGERFLAPLAAALWSCPSDRVHQFPIRFVAGFLLNHHMLQLHGKPVWRVVKGGSNVYLKALVARTKAEFKLAAPVERIERTADSIQINFGSRSEYFDEAIVAVHADQALKIHQDPTLEECALLSAFRYQANDVVLHTDTSLLPKSQKAWASWNYRIPSAFSDSATVTYDMNLLQGLESDLTYCVSLNEMANIAPEKVIGRYVYHHPVASRAGLDAQTKRSRLIRHRGISYVGAYWGYGFHEDGMRSAVEVAAAFEEGPA
ncbi:MAG TPA: FAD-dependent oxidoreductase [Fimbriimonadaceae bacterium]|nr:FAD-dependent oxidoreductase [Fimbriimonadaceae bacterium]